MATVAYTLVDSSSLNLLDYLNPFTDNFTSAGDGAQIYAYDPLSGDIPFALLDESDGAFSGDGIGIIDASTVDPDTRAFFGITDTVNGDNPTFGPDVFAEWTFDISGASDLSLSVDIAAMGDFEAADLFSFSFAIDGGGYVTLFDIAADEAASQDYTLANGSVETLDDPLAIDGTLLSNALTTFTASLAGTGSELTLRFDGITDGGSEGLVFRNIVIEGETEPFVVINEFVADHAGADTAEYVELYGTPGFDLTGFSLLEIEGDGAGAGTVDLSIDLTGMALDGDGYLLLDNAAVDGIENGTITLMLVQGFEGAADIDADDDGTAELLTGTVIDSVALFDGGVSDLVYSETVLDEAFDDAFYDSPFEPGGASRIPNGYDSDTASDWRRNDFAQVGTAAGEPEPGEAYNTPGAANLSVEDEPPAPELVFIHEIQGSFPVSLNGERTVGVDDVSPLLGRTVTVQAVVTADFEGGGLGGFFIQEEAGDYDDDPLSSEGIFVFNGFSSDDVEVGQIVNVTGTVSEFEGATQISAQSIEIVGLGASPEATVLSFPAAGVMSDGQGDYVADLEAYEGMLVTIPEELAITELFQLNRFGTIRVSSEGRLEQFTQGNAPDAAGYDQHLKDVAARSLIIDDGAMGSPTQNPETILVPDGNNGVLDAADSFRMGDGLRGVTGVLAFGEDNESSSEEPEFRIHLPQAEFVQNNPQPEAPEDAGGRLKVASLNVLNYFTTLDTNPGSFNGPYNSGPNDDQEPRGANDEAEFARQQAKVVNAILGMDADVVGLMEIENDDDIAVSALVDALNAEAGSTDWGYIATGDVGGDAITTAFVYRLDAVAPVGEAAILDDASFVDPLDTGSDRNRPTVAQTFEEIATGAKFTAAVNHFKSKGASGLDAGVAGDPDSDQGDGAGFWNGTRAAAAEAVLEWLGTDPTGSGDDDFILLGDFNSYAMEDPILALRAGGDGVLGTADDWTDLAGAFIGEAAYSYVFDGQAGTLDYAFGNGSLTSQVTGVTEWHINADEATAFDYNLDFGRDPALFDGSTPFRGSDHDPVIVGLDLDIPLNLVVGTDRNDRLVGTEGNDLIVTKAGRSDFATGNGGDDVFFFGEETADGTRDKTRILDYGPGDVIDLDGASFEVVRETRAFVELAIGEDGDRLILQGVSDAGAIEFADSVLT